MCRGRRAEGSPCWLSVAAVPSAQKALCYSPAAGLPFIWGSHGDKRQDTEFLRWEGLAQLVQSYFTSEERRENSHLPN